MREEREMSRARRWATGALMVGVLTLVVYGIYRAATGEAVVPKKVVSDVVTMRLVEPPPPPPPPPKLKMEEQPKEREMVDRPQPLQDVPPPPINTNAAPPPGPLALDSQGQGAPDAFGLAGRPGGTDILGGGGGAAGSAYGWYASLVEGRIQDALRRNKHLRGRRYDVAVAVRLASDGQLQAVEFLNASGKADLDGPVLEALRSGLKLPQPPRGMPQPINIHVRAY